MTRRSIILGLLGAVAVCAVTYFNDWVLRQTHFVGNNMPVSIYGSLVLFVLFVNRWLKRWALSGAELAVVLTIVLAACAVPGSGLMRTFPDTLVLPYHYNRIEPAWKENGVLEAIPPRMLVDTSVNSDLVVDGYIQGLSTGSGHVSPAAIPWRAWVRPCLFWMPMILCLLLALVGLSAVVHRQWSENEHLPYPLAGFTGALLPEEGQRVSGLWGQRLFWLGLAGVFVLHLNNYLVRWFPDYLIEVPLRLDFRPVAWKFPLLLRGEGWFVFNSPVYFAVIGLSFFIAADLAAAFGFGPILWSLAVGTFAGYGVSLTASFRGGGYLGISPRSFVLFGACLGVFLALLYSGRHHYLAVLRRALGLPAARALTTAEVWGARAFLLLAALFTLQLSLAGIDWQLAVLFTGILVISYVVSARLMAEGGLFHIKVDVFPGAILWGLAGAAALGWHTILLLQFVTIVLFIDPRETLMPFLANANRLLQLKRVPIGRVGAIAGLAIVLGLAVALPVTLYIQYDVPAATQGDAWAFQYVPKMPFDNAVTVRQRLDAMGLLETAEAQTGWGRFGAVRPVTDCLWAFVAGLGLVLVATAGRIRFPWWPVHPLLFVVWAKSHISAFAVSFILGWLLKTIVMRYGGSRLYNRLKPLMLGLVAGEILGAVVPSIVGAVYYVCTGRQPVSYVLYVG